MGLYAKETQLEQDPELDMQRGMAQFACFCGKGELGCETLAMAGSRAVFVYREMEAGPDKVCR